MAETSKKNLSPKENKKDPSPASEKIIVSTKSIIITLNIFDDNTAKVNKDIEGLSFLEAIGVLEHAKNSLFREMDAKSEKYKESLGKTS